MLFTDLDIIVRNRLAQLRVTFLFGRKFEKLGVMLTLSPPSVHICVKQKVLRKRIHKKSVVRSKNPPKRRELKVLIVQRFLGLHKSLRA